MEPYWPMLFAKYLGEKDICELLMKPSCGAAAPVGEGRFCLRFVAAAAAGDAPAEEEDVDMSGGGLFGGDDDDW